jgi:K+-sensing histidine kinase KdpD
VLDLPRSEAGQVELELEPFSLQDALERGVADGARARNARRRPVTLAANPDVDVVARDERRVRQVIFNLLSNAVKFTSAGGSVDVIATRANGEVRVSVADTGPGIAEDDLGRIFEEFQQTEAGASQHEGTGLGLALSRRFVEMHGGRIWCDSEVGKGSTFVFTIPAGGRAMTDLHVLVVEDNERNMRLFRDVLEAAGHRYSLRRPVNARWSCRRARAPTWCSWTSSSRHRRRRGPRPTAGDERHERCPCSP